MNLHAKELNEFTLAAQASPGNAGGPMLQHKYERADCGYAGTGARGIRRRVAGNHSYGT
jgi:hypothetical protein